MKLNFFTKFMWADGKNDKFPSDRYLRSIFEALVSHAHNKNKNFFYC